MYVTILPNKRIRFFAFFIVYLKINEKLPQTNNKKILNSCIIIFFLAFRTFFIRKTQKQNNYNAQNKIQRIA